MFSLDPESISPAGIIFEGWINKGTALRGSDDEGRAEAIIKGTLPISRLSTARVTAFS